VKDADDCAEGEHYGGTEDASSPDVRFCGACNGGDEEEPGDDEDVCPLCLDPFGGAALTTLNACHHQ